MDDGCVSEVWKHRTLAVTVHNHQLPFVQYAKKTKQNRSATSSVATLQTRARTSDDASERVSKTVSEVCAVKNDGSNWTFQDSDDMTNIYLICIKYVQTEKTSERLAVCIRVYCVERVWKHDFKLMNAFCLLEWIFSGEKWLSWSKGELVRQCK